MGGCVAVYNGVVLGTGTAVGGAREVEAIRDEGGTAPGRESPRATNTVVTKAMALAKAHRCGRRQCGMVKTEATRVGIDRESTAGTGIFGLTAVEPRTGMDDIEFGMKDETEGNEKIAAGGSIEG